MKKTSWWILMLIILMIIIAIWLILKKSAKKEEYNPKSEKPQIKVDAIIVKPTLLVEEISVSGSLLAFDEVELKNEVAGRVVQINLPEGKFVKEGTLLVKLFDGDLQANLKKFQTQLAIQEKIHQRQTELLKVNGISQNEYEQTGLQLNELQADIEIQKALIRKTEVLAPFDGIIGLRNISIGAEVTPATLLATIRSNDKLKLDFSVPEKYSPKIRQGMNVKFSMYNEDTLYDATVIATEQGIDANTRNLRVRAIVNSFSEHLLPGAYANVLLQLGSNKQALMVPSKAIIPHEQFKNVIIANNGNAHFKTVKTGVRNASGVEITDGIQPGDTVITSGILFVKEGSKLFYSNVSSDSL
jgi:membrane fusion protein, multidrug efflux system